MTTIKHSLKHTQITITGLDLLKLLRVYARDRADAADLITYDGYRDLIESDPPESELQAAQMQINVRSQLGGLAAAKRFVDGWVAEHPGQVVYTEDE